MQKHNNLSMLRVMDAYSGLIIIIIIVIIIILIMIINCLFTKLGSQRLKYSFRST